MKQEPSTEMSTNVEIGDRLKLERQRLGLGQEEFGRKAGVSKTSQFNYESGGRMPDAAYLAAAHLIGVDVLFVVTGNRSAGNDDSFVVVPRHNAYASAGPGAVNGHDAESQVEGLCFSRRWLNKRGLSPANLRVIDVSGESMSGKLSDGDKVLIDLGQTLPKSGYAYVLRQDDELLVKYCQLLPEGILRLSSENPNFPPYDINLAKSQDVSILGRVVASTHEW
ncbi:LexA family transcriptional regulator [Rhodoferax sp.]|uniref:XRE family transcriptional regulator n=1 Tax=Rhodoferax sp. TaxID=50421 RepID=UPI0028435D75|nr:LexA family transcriptional regulator [Rhodoferax sp.]MDR3370692.1 LexA family transcriptional regulator [Rhodoferax sp.]